MVTSVQAQEVLRAGATRAAKIGVSVNIAILDTGAFLKAFIRMDGAVPGSIDVAMKKARTAVLFDAPSEAVWEYCKPGAAAHCLELSNDGLAPFAGGVLIKGKDGKTLGAIGVSGGAVTQDLDIALAAAAAFSD